MSKLELHTSVEETLVCDEIPSLILKKVNIGNNYYWTPIRSIYLSTEIPKDIRNRILELKTKQTIFEVNRVIYRDQQYKSINNAIIENDDEKIKNILRVNEIIGSERLSIVFSFSDFPERRLGRNFEELLDGIHAFSNSEILFVPHVRYSKSAKTAVEYNAKPFCKYIDSAIDVLKEKNTKSIFVPFDIDYPQKTRDDILMHYAKYGYTNIWVDLKGKSFNKNVIRKIRTFWRVANKLFGENAKNIIIYLANIRKVPRRTPGDFKLSPSDFLGILTYGDFVGAPFKGVMGYTDDQNFWLRKGYPTKEDYERDLLKRESSIFDSSSYYYIHPDRLSFDNRKLERIREAILTIAPSRKHVAEKASYSASGIITLSEINQIKKEIEQEGRILDYVESKEFFKNEGVSLLEELRKPAKIKIERKEKELFDFI